MMISELLKKGYNVAPKDTVKNGVLKKGIAFLSAPHSITIFHVDELLNYAEVTHRSLDWAVSKVLNCADQSWNWHSGSEPNKQS